MLGCIFRHWFLYKGNNLTNITLRLAKLIHYVFTDHTHAVNVNTVTTLTNIVDINKVHHQTPPLYEDTP